MHNDNIISYFLDKYNLKENLLDNDIKELYKDSILLFCASAEGHLYKDKYPVCEITPFYINTIRFQLERIKIDRMDPYDRFFDENEREQARKDGGSVTRYFTKFPIEKLHQVGFTIDNIEYKISHDTYLNEIRIRLEYKNILYFVLTSNKDLYKSGGSDEWDTYTYVNRKYVVPNLQHSFVVYLLRLAMIYMPVLSYKYSSYIDNRRNKEHDYPNSYFFLEHPLVSTYIGKSKIFDNPPEQAWINTQNGI